MAKKTTKELLELIQKKTQLSSFNDVSIPEEFKTPIDTHTPVNKVLSSVNGLLKSQVIMLTAEAGTGKTTVSLEIAEGVAKSTGKKVVFISQEMSDFQLVDQANRLQIDYNSMIVIKERGHWDAWLRDLAPIASFIGLIILDSVQKVAEATETGNQGQTNVLVKFTEFAKTHMISVILIGHCNKDGTYRGPSFMLHECDTHIHIDIDRSTKIRTVQVGKKNRFGSDMNKAFFNLDEKGKVVWLDNKEVEIDQESNDELLTDNDFDLFEIDLEDLNEINTSIILNKKEN